MSEQPIFEVIGNTFHAKIYESGKIEGFPDDGKCIVISRIGISVLRSYKAGIEDQYSRNQCSPGNGDMGG